MSPEVRRRRKFLKQAFKDLLDQPEVRHQDVVGLMGVVDVTLKGVQDEVREKVDDTVEYQAKYKALLDQYLVMLGKIGPRPIVEALENSFSYAFSYSEDFNAFKSKENPSRSEIWKWVLMRDSKLKKAATMNGFLSANNAADHVVSCYRYHSDMIHSNDFSSYDYIPVYHYSLIQAGYTKKQLTAYPEDGAPIASGRFLDYKGTAFILVALAKLAGYDSPAAVDNEGVKPH